MGELRNRMEADMNLRRYSRYTPKEYLRCMNNFASHFMHSPDEMEVREIRAFLIHLVDELRVSASVQHTLIHYLFAYI